MLDALGGVPRLVGLLSYGSGLRLLEACGLRVKDIYFERGEILVRGGKGGRDRVTVLADSAAAELLPHLQRVKQQYQRDGAAGRGYVMLPGALSRKSPAAAREWRWYWVFPATRGYRDPVSGHWVRHHIHPTVIQRAVRAAATRAGVEKRVTCHAFRHSFATHLLEAGYDIRTMQELLGHRDASTTMLYTHVLNRGGRGVRSPADVDPSRSGLPLQAPRHVEGVSHTHVVSLSQQQRFRGGGATAGRRGR